MKLLKRLWLLAIIVSLIDICGSVRPTLPHDIASGEKTEMSSPNVSGNETDESTTSEEMRKKLGREDEDGTHFLDKELAVWKATIRQFIEMDKMVLASIMFFPAFNGVLLILMTRAMSKDSDRTNHQQYPLFVFLAVLSAYAYGFVLGTNQDTRYLHDKAIVAAVGTPVVLTLVANAFRAGNVTFGYPDYPRGLRLQGFLAGCLMVTCRMAWYYRSNALDTAFLNTDNPHEKAEVDGGDSEAEYFKAGMPIDATHHTDGMWYAATVLEADYEHETYKIAWSSEHRFDTEKRLDEIRCRCNYWIDQYPVLRYHCGGELSILWRDNQPLFVVASAYFFRSFALYPMLFHVFGAWMIKHGEDAIFEDHARKLGMWIMCGCIFTRHMRDQLLVAGLGVVVDYASRAGYRASMHQHSVPPLWLVAYLVLGAYLSMIFSRRCRILPAALNKCGYVRLGFLRRMTEEGAIIKRYQELPADAFGDPAKAAELIITSHRWLDRFTCDVPTDECPLGLRLTTMTKTLEEFYPQTCSGNLMAMFRSMRLCGWDVLVFFDFMALPQIGKTEDGVEIPRTEEETAIFKEALPQMGELYSMYPVLVLPEVTEFVHPYSSSGWCFCEFEQALLMRRLSKYSQAFLDENEKDNSAKSSFGTTGSEAASMFIQDFEDRLADKKLFFDSDRDIIRGIVCGKLLLRSLADAVRCQDVEGTRMFLEKLKDKDLTYFVNTAVDDTLNTLLHIAVRLPCEEITTLLLDTPGIDTEARNLRGDTPWQYFLMPVGISKTCCCCLFKAGIH